MRLTKTFNFVNNKDGNKREIACNELIINKLSCKKDYLLFSSPISEGAFPKCFLNALLK